MLADAKVALRRGSTALRSLTTCSPGNGSLDAPALAWFPASLHRTPPSPAPGSVPDVSQPGEQVTGQCDAPPPVTLFSYPCRPFLGSVQNALAWKHKQDYQAILNQEFCLRQGFYVQKLLTCPEIVNCSGEHIKGRHDPSYYRQK